jgi:SNF2 family DNA or RNA helicase
MLSSEMIKNMFPDSYYRRGLQYYHQFRVEQLTNAEKNSHWTAKVAGNKLYNVEVDIFEDEIFYNCTCSAYEEYQSCKHCVAVLLEIANKLGEKSPIKEIESNEQKSSISIERQEEQSVLIEDTISQLSINLIDTFAEDDFESTATVVGEPIKVEYSLKPEYQAKSTLLTVEMKMGIERLYVVKNLKEILDFIEKKKEYYFSKSFSYDPYLHTFQEEDLEIFQLLSKINTSESFFKNRDPWNISSAKQKGITIPPLFADQLISLLHERNCKLQNGDEEFNHFKWTSEQLPFAFSLLKDEGNYLLELQKSNLVEYMSKYGYLLVDNAIYKLNEHQQQVMQRLSTIIDLESTTSIPIKQEEIGLFISHVVPSLKIICNVDIAPEVHEAITNPPLHAQLFLEIDMVRITAKLEYHYGDDIILPFNEDSTINEEKILVRDVKKERKIMKLIELSSFKFNGVELYLEDEDYIFSFLYDILPKLEEVVTIFSTGDISPLINKDELIPDIQLDLQTSANYFEVNFDFTDVNQTEIQQVIKSIVEKKRYYRLQDGSYLPLEEETFNPIGDLFRELNIAPETITNGKLTLPSYRSLQVEELVSRNKGVHYNKAFEKLIADIKKPSMSNYPLPKSLNADLRDYQIVGYQWLRGLSHYHFGGILADDMGLGKTLQAIAFLLSKWEETNGSTQPALVVSPASLVYNWQNEFVKFAPNLKVKVIHGSKSERENLINDIENYDVFITSYPLVRQDFELYNEHEFSTLILDEAQAIKNHMTKTARAIKTIRKANCFALSGTPIENSLDELWSIFDAILPGFFPNKKTFSSLSQEQISRMSRPFILRRLKKDVLKELPDKIETVHTSELTKDQKELYLGYLEKIQSEAALAMSSNGFQKNRMKILAGLTRLRQLCCHPSLFIENYLGESGKMNQLLEMVDNALENKQRILIFSQFSSMLKIIQTQLENKGIKLFYLDGNTPSSKRVEYAERFNNGENDIFLISLKAGGTGLNLPGADTVILYDLWWNPAVEDRMGQKKVVQVFRLITNGTIEEKIFSLQQKKKELIENIIHPGETMFSSLTEQEIRELLSV